MALKYQYNKNALQDLRRQLSIRENALPILKRKETALRHEIRLIQKELDGLKENLNKAKALQPDFGRHWVEFPDVLRVDSLNIVKKNVVGVKIPHLKEINFEIRNISWFNHSAWLPAGLEALQEVIDTQLRINIAEKQIAMLHLARKKTTQKVNLYEKVQIPAYQEALRRIKRFLEDKDNITKAGQKIVKKKNNEKHVPV